MLFKIKKMEDFGEEIVGELDIDTIEDIVDLSVAHNHKLVLDGRDNTIIIYNKSRCLKCNYGDLNDFDLCQ